MTKVLAGLVAAGIAFIILYPILGITLWVSFLVAACILVVVASAGAMRTIAH